MKNDSKYVDGCEELHRHIRSNKENPNEAHYTVEESGNILIDRAAFSSGNPSVNRAKLTCCPEDTKERPSDGVIGIWTKDIEDITLPDYPDYIVKVKKSPKKDKVAHAEIVLLSEKEEVDKISRGLSRQFRNLLADISVCIVKPNPL